MPGAPLTLFSEESWLSALKVRGRRDECSAVGSNQRQSGDAQVLATWIEDECLGAHDLVVTNAGPPESPFTAGGALNTIPAGDTVVRKSTDHVRKKGKRKSP